MSKVFLTSFTEITYTEFGLMPGPLIKNGTLTSNSNGKLFPLINPNCPK